MATENALRSITLPSAADFSTTGQWRFGTVNSSGQIALAGAAARVDGIIQSNPDAADKECAVGIHGVSHLELGGTIAAGDSLQSGASGVGVSGTTNVKAIALESGVSGDVISVLLLG
jgi:hypothetical protein